VPNGTHLNPALLKRWRWGKKCWVSFMLEALDEIDALWEIDRAPATRAPGYQPPEHQDTSRKVERAPK